MGKIITIPKDLVLPKPAEGEVTPLMQRHFPEEVVPEEQFYDVPDEWDDSAFLRPINIQTAEDRSIQGWIDKDNKVRVGVDEIGTWDPEKGEFMPKPTEFWSWESFTGSLGFVGSTLGMASLKALEWFYKPLELAHEWIMKPFIIAATAPWWKRELKTAFPEDIWKGIRELMPGGELREAYDEWDSPRYLKGALEFLPWLIIPSFGVIGKALKGMGAAGAVASKVLFPYIWTERLAGAALAAPFRGAHALAKLIKKPVMKAGKQVDTMLDDVQTIPPRYAVKAGTVVDDVGKVQTLPDAADYSGYLDEIARTEPTRVRRKNQIELIIDDARRFDRHTTTHSRLYGTLISEEWLGSGDRVRKLLGLKRLPGTDMWDSVVRNPNVRPKVKGASMTYQKIAEAPHKYDFIGQEGQEILRLIKNEGELFRMILAQAKRYDIPLKEFVMPDAEAQFIGRTVVAKVFPDEFAPVRGFKKFAQEIGVDWKGRYYYRPRRFPRAEKVRKYVDIDDAIADGFIYTDPVTNMRFRLAQIYHRIHQRDIWDMMKTLALTESERMNMGLLKAFDVWKGTKKDLQYVRETLRRVAKLKPGQALPSPVARKLFRVFPEVGERVEQILKKGRLDLDSEAVAVARAEMLAERMDELPAHIEGLKRTLDAGPARKFIDAVTKHGQYKGEIATLTKHQYRILTGGRWVRQEAVVDGVKKIKRVLVGGREPTRGMLTPDGKRVRWEYALDDIATEHGYRSGDELREAIQRAGQMNQELKAARAELAFLKPQYKDAKAREMAILMTRKEAITELLPLVEAKLRGTDVKIKEIETLMKVVREMKGKVQFTEGTTVGIPQLANRIFPDLLDADGKVVMFGSEIRDKVIKALGVDTAPKALELAAKVSRVMVAQKATLDASWWLIQGQRVLGFDVAQWAKGNPSIVWLKSIKEGLRTLFNLDNLIDFNRKHQATLLKHPELPLVPHDMLIGAGVMERWARKLPILGDRLSALIHQSYGRAAAMFNAGGHASRVLMIEAVEDAWMAGGGTRLGLVNYASLTSGIVDTSRAGVPLSRQLAESTVLFSPNFTRCWLTNLRYLFRGDFTARKVQADLAGMLAAILLGYTSISALTGQEPKLNPAPKHLGGDGAEFLTFTVNGTVIGLPGWGYSLLRMMFGLGALAEQYPESLVKFDTRHPAMQFLLGRQSPVIGAIREIATGRDFIGRRIDTPGDWAMVYAQKLMPIAMQSLLVEEHPGTGRYKAFGAELWGLRTYPKSSWDQLRDMRDEYAGLEFQKKWEDLNTEQRDILLEKYPEYREFYESAEEEVRLQRGEDIDIILWGQQRLAEAVYHGTLEPMARKVFTGEVSYRDYLAESRNLRRVFTTTKRVISNIRDWHDPEIAKRAQKRLEEALPEDIALDKYWDVANLIKRTPEGFPDWDERETRIQAFLDGLTPEIAQYVIRNRNRWIRFLPPAMRIFAELEVEGRDIIDPYYDVPEGQPRIKFREANPAIDAWLILLGRVSVPQSDVARRLALDLARKRGIPLTAFPRLLEAEPEPEKRIIPMTVVRA